MYHAYYILNDKKVDFYFEEDEVLLEIFINIKNKTGVCIDEYTDLKFYPDHQQLLVDLLQEKNGYDQMVVFFKSAIHHDLLVYFWGN